MPAVDDLALSEASALIWFLCGGRGGVCLIAFRLDKGTGMRTMSQFVRRRVRPGYGVGNFEKQ